MKKLLVVTCFLIFAIACGGPQEGYVKAKRYEPENTYVMFMPMTVGQTCTGSLLVCISQTILIPYVMHDDEDWVVVVHDEEGNAGTVYTTERAYDEAVMDEWFSGPVEVEKDTRLRKANDEEVEERESH